MKKVVPFTKTIIFKTHIAEITEIERGSTWLLNEENGIFNLMSHLGDASMLSNKLTPDDSNVIHTIQETKEPVEYEEGRNESIVLSEKDKTIFGTSFVVVPILLKLYLKRYQLILAANLY